ncbi:MAG: inorganic phosphate transporter [Bacteroidales bacterium]|nr:inorganic phosphate transporter [Bacteroidales bacterium]
MNLLTLAIVLSILLAFVFTFLNGMNDAANSISTIIATKVMTPIQAIVWASFWEFTAFIFIRMILSQQFAVGNTMANFAEQSVITPYLVLSALVGAAIWVAVCTKMGMPISTSHALIGGIIGAAWFVNGGSVLHLKPILITLSFIIFSPLIGLFLGFFLECIFLKIFKNKPRKKVEKLFKRLQHFSTAAFCIGHGSNDAPKTMGIIAILMASVFTTPGVSQGMQDFIGLFYDSSKSFHIPDTLAVICYVIMSLGILIGGKNVIKTMGGGLAKINPVRGFSAEAAGATTLIVTSMLGIPVSTTHTITGGVIGVGLTDGIKSVKWVTAKRIVLSWILTIPVPLLISGILNTLLNSFFPL